jgi:hypothetical protein
MERLFWKTLSLPNEPKATGTSMTTVVPGCDDSVCLE